MRTIFANSLQRRLLGVMLITSLAGLVAALGAMIGYDMFAYHKSWVGDMTAQASLLAKTTAPAVAFDDAKMAHENLGFLRSQPKVRAAAIYDAHGELFSTYLGVGEHAPLPLHPAGDGARVEQRKLIVFKRIVENGEFLGTVYVQADYELYDRIANYLGIALVVALLGMLVALLVSSRLQNIVTRPILAIAQIA
ncbi:MAG: CHASE sensor domain-containing protein, partial [Pseudomonadota bacterium]